MKKEILLIEDEASIARFIKLDLEHEGYAVDTAADGREGLDAALDKDYDLIILDLMLPSLSGAEVLRRLRQIKKTPVIILTARSQVMDKVNGLDLGADDYMTKPFAIEELLARMRVVFKRYERDEEEDRPGLVRIGLLNVDTEGYTASYDGQSIELTKREFDLLSFLISKRGSTVSRESILDVVWGYDFYGDTNVVDVYVRYLRGKIDERFGIKLIHTVRGAGYLIKHDKKLR